MLLHPDAILTFILLTKTFSSFSKLIAFVAYSLGELQNTFIQSCPRYKVSFNYGHNILRHFDILANFLVTTRETKRDF